MRLGRVGAAAAADDRRRPALAPEALELDRFFHRGDRVRRITGERPGAQCRVESGEHAALGILARRPDRECRRDARGRAIDDLADAFPVEERQRVDKDEASNSLARQFRRPAQHHAAGAGAGEHDIAQILVEHQLGDLGGVRRGGNAGSQRVAALAAAVERRGMDEVTGGSEARRCRLPNPAALIGPVDQHKVRHWLPPALID